MHEVTIIFRNLCKLMIKCPATTCALLLAAVVLTGCGGGDVQNELKALEGTWKLVAAEEGGQAIPQDKLPAISFTFQPDGTSTVRGPEGEFQTRSSVDPTKNPKTIDIVFLSGPLKGRQQYGIYKVEGDRQTVVATLADAKAEDRPVDFTTKGTKTRLMVWQREK